MPAAGRSPLWWVCDGGASEPRREGLDSRRASNGHCWAGSVLSRMGVSERHHLERRRVHLPPPPSTLKVKPRAPTRTRTSCFPPGLRPWSGNPLSPRSAAQSLAPASFDCQAGRLAFPRPLCPKSRRVRVWETLRTPIPAQPAPRGVHGQRRGAQGRTDRPRGARGSAGAQGPG